MWQLQSNRSGVGKMGRGCVDKRGRGEGQVGAGGHGWFASGPSGQTLGMCLSCWGTTSRGRSWWRAGPGLWKGRPGALGAPPALRPCSPPLRDVFCPLALLLQRSTPRGQVPPEKQAPHSPWGHAPPCQLLCRPHPLSPWREADTPGGPAPG